jgi:subtilase family serine protease
MQIFRMRAVRRHAWLSACVCLAALSTPATAEQRDFHGNTIIGPVLREELLTFRIYLPPRDPDGLASFVQHVSTPSDPLFHHFLSAPEEAARFGPTPADLATLKAAVARAGLSVTGSDSRSVGVLGRSDLVESFIGTTLSRVVTPAGKPLLAAAAPIKLPDDISALGAKIFAFRGKISMHSMLKLVEPQEAGNTGTGPFLTSDLKQAYDAPSSVSVDGKGATIGILIDGAIAQSDLDSYFSMVGLTTRPSFTVEPVDGGGTAASVEGTLDVSQAGGFAPGAAIIQYQLPDLTDQSIIDGLNQIITDNTVDVVSMSFSACELDFLAFWDGPFSTVDTLLAEDSMFQEGSAQGITFVAASGDNGALACAPAGYGNAPANLPVSGSFVAGVGNPASSPNVTAVGGTNLTVTSGGAASAYVAENADFDPIQPEPGDDGLANLDGGVWGSGGGASVLFPQPSYQTLVTTGVPVRAVPDLALHMGGCPANIAGTCPAARSFDQLVFQGQTQGVIGTSAATPDFAGVVALMVQNSGQRQGLINPYIYTRAQAQNKGGAASFHRAIPGNNGVFASSANGSPTYNLVIGNGSLDIRQFMQATNLPAAGAPGSASNP